MLPVVHEIWRAYLLKQLLINLPTYILVFYKINVECFFCSLGWPSQLAFPTPESLLLNFYLAYLSPISFLIFASSLPYFFPWLSLFIRVSDPVFLHGSGSGSSFQISPDPDPVFKFLRIRIRFSNFSGSGFQIFWIRTWIRFQPRFWKIAERSLKVIYQKKT